jgi:hypothetical protein
VPDQEQDHPTIESLDRLPETNMAVIAEVAKIPYASVYAALRRRRSASVRQYRVIADALRLDIGTLLDLVDGGYWAEGYGGPRNGPLANQDAIVAPEPNEDCTIAPEAGEVANTPIVEATTTDKKETK